MAVEVGPGSGRTDAAATSATAEVGDGSTAPTGAAAPGHGPTGDRPLTADEAAHLDRLRRDLAASGVDVTDAAALGALYDRSRRAWSQAGGGSDPRPLVRALGVGLGDVLAARSGGRWMLRSTPDGTAPVVLTSTWCVAPLEEVAVRWRTGEDAWVDRWVERCVAHLTGVRGRHGGPAVGGSDPVLPSPAGPVDATSIGSAPTAPGVHQTPRVTVRDGVPRPSSAPSGTQAALPVPSTDPPRTPDELPVPPSSHAQDLALRALAQAVDDVVPAGGPLTPFAMTDDGHDVVVRRFDDPVLARTWVRASGASRAAIAWQGHLDDHRDGPTRQPEGSRPVPARDAVFVEAGDRGRPGFVVAHRYSSVPGVSRIVGTPEIVGSCAPVL